MQVPGLKKQTKINTAKQCTVLDLTTVLHSILNKEKIPMLSAMSGFKVYDLCISYGFTQKKANLCLMPSFSDHEILTILSLYLYSTSDLKENGTHLSTTSGCDILAHWSPLSHGHRLFLSALSENPSLQGSKHVRENACAIQ